MAKLGRNPFETDPVWSKNSSEVFKFYCPHCKSERRLAHRPTPGGFRHNLQILLTTAFATLLLWPILEWKGVVSLLPIWAVYETVFRVRTRNKLACDNCGFDPYLFMVDAKLARNEIEKYWRDKFKQKGIPYPGDPVELKAEVPVDDEDSQTELSDLDEASRQDTSS